MHDLCLGLYESDYASDDDSSDWVLTRPQIIKSVGCQAGPPQGPSPVEPLAAPASTVRPEPGKTAVRRFELGGDMVGLK